MNKFDLTKKIFRKIRMNRWELSRSLALAFCLCITLQVRASDLEIPANPKEREKTILKLFDTISIPPDPISSKEYKDKYEHALMRWQSLGPFTLPWAGKMIELLGTSKMQYPERFRIEAYVFSQLGPDVASTLRWYLRSSSTDARLRAVAAEAAAHQGSWGLPLIPDLVICLKDPDQGVRASAAFALGTYGQDAASAVEPLLKLFEEENRKSVHANAYTAWFESQMALRAIGTPEAMAAYNKCVEMNAPKVNPAPQPSGKAISAKSPTIPVRPIQRRAHIAYWLFVNIYAFFIVWILFKLSNRGERA